jgi:hypothetical protein
MGKRQTLSIIFLAFVFYNAAALSPGENYFYTGKWYRGYEIGGEIRIQLTVLETGDDRIVISLKKEMTPFLETLIFTAEALYEKDKYVFHGFDNWDNKIAGYFTVDALENEKIILFFDAEQFSDIGKNSARLYGDTSILIRK